MKEPLTLEQKIALRIAESEQEVFLRKDFDDLGSYGQVGRCLRNLIQKEKLIRIGQGLYAKAIQSPLSNKIIPPDSIGTIAREALNRLGIKTLPSTYQRRYNSGQTTQVPTGRVIGVNKRVTRKIGFDGTYVTFERV